jgi:hypothetical protein
LTTSVAERGSAAGRLRHEVGVGGELEPARLACVARLDGEGLARRRGKRLEAGDARLERFGAGPDKRQRDQRSDGGETHMTALK